MIGFVLVAHGKLAQETLSVLEHVVGTQSNCCAISIASDGDGDSERNKIVQAVEKCDEGQGVIIITDMFGGTPSNLAIALLSNPNVEVIAGMNMPMLVKISSLRETASSLKELVTEGQKAGKKYIVVASEML